MSHIFNLKTMQHTNLATTSFSSIDLQTKIDDKTTGIVFPFKNTKAEYHPSFSSIVKIQNNICYMAHSQYRIITNNPHTGYANYTLMPSITFNIFNKQQTLLGKVLNKPEIVQEHVITDMDLTIESESVQQDIQNISKSLNSILNKYCPIILIDTEHLEIPDDYAEEEYEEEYEDDDEDEFIWYMNGHAVNETDKEDYVNEHEEILSYLQEQKNKVYDGYYENTYRKIKKGK